MPPPQSNALTTPTQAPILKLPTTREGVKKWLSAKKLFSSNSGSTTNTPEQLELGEESSMTDLFFSKKEDLAADWDDVGSEKSWAVDRFTMGSDPGEPHAPLYRDGYDGPS